MHAFRLSIPLSAALLAPGVASAEGVRQVDLSASAPTVGNTAPPAAGLALSDLDAIALPALPRDPSLRGTVVQTHGEGELQPNPEVVAALKDIPGYEYPRKHTLYMNFVGADLQNGSDNSAENKSTLALFGSYPAFTGGEQTAVAAAQEMANDLSQLGVRVLFDPDDRPPQILPYTMAMIGGSWQDVNIDQPAGGVAPGTDCGALGQRHVVYVFADGGWGATGIANVTAQEVGHSWGLDHSLNCGSVMSYCGAGNGNFSSNCDDICEAQCDSLAGCDKFHENFCGEGSGQQNEGAELGFIFGGSEPDIEPPFVEIVSPDDAVALPLGADVDLRAVVDDNYGGFGWSFLITRDGEVLYDEVDYGREVDSEYRAALNLVNLEAGDYEITVTVMDHADQISTDTVVFSVGAAETSGGEAGLDDGGGSGTGEASTSDDGGSGGPGSSGGAGQAPAEGTGMAAGASSTGAASAGAGDESAVEDRGCACASTALVPGAWWLALLPLLGIGRRSRGFGE